MRSSAVKIASSTSAYTGRSSALKTPCKKCGMKIGDLFSRASGG